MVQNWNFNLELFLLASPIIIYIGIILCDRPKTTPCDKLID